MVVHERSLWRYAAAQAAVGFGTSVLIRLTIGLMSSSYQDIDTLISDSIVFVVLYTVGYAGFSLLFTFRRPMRLGFGDDAVELAADGRDGVLVPYEIVRMARVRWWWPLTTLDVVIDAADESRVTYLGRGGRRPVGKREGGRLRFTMLISGLSVPAADIRSRFQHRRPVPDGDQK